MLKAIGLEITVSDSVMVDIVANADDNPQARRVTISNRSRGAGVEPLEASSRHEAIIDGPPHLGAWLMPDNKSKGELDDFVKGMIPCKGPVWLLVWDMVRVFLNRLPQYWKSGHG